MFRNSGSSDGNSLDFEFEPGNVIFHMNFQDLETLSLLCDHALTKGSETRKFRILRPERLYRNVLPIVFRFDFVQGRLGRLDLRVPEEA